MKRNLVLLNYAGCAFPPLCILLLYGLAFSKPVKITSVIPCAFPGAGVFECKYLGEVSVATSIYVFKSLLLFVDELMLCS